MPSPQDQYDDAMLEFSRGNYSAACVKLQALLAETPDFFDACLSLAMAYHRLGNTQAAITEGLKAEKLRPQDPLVHTNLSLFYVAAGDRALAEHHGARAKLASWKTALTEKPDAGDPLQPAAAKPAGIKVAAQLPDMPWKRKQP